MSFSFTHIWNMSSHNYKDNRNMHKKSQEIKSLYSEY